MTVDVRLEIERTFRVRASPSRVFEVLADVPYSVSHFPDVESLEDQGDDVYRPVVRRLNESTTVNLSDMPGLSVTTCVEPSQAGVSDEDVQRHLLAAA